jgi:imidazolonepropionase-like amidohydrolase
LLFGTDVGYITDCTMAGSSMHFVGSGLGPKDMLRLLTTAPAGPFKVNDHTGTLATGMDADLVLLNGDPVGKCEVVQEPALHHSSREGRLRRLPSVTLARAETRRCRAERGYASVP